MTINSKLKKAIMTGALIVGAALVSGNVYAQDNKPVKKAVPIVQQKEADIDFGVSAGVEYNFKNPIDYTALNKKFKDGYYTSTTPVPQWQDITPTTNSLIMPEFKGKVRIKVADGIRIEAEGGYKSGSLTNAYDQTYTILGGVNEFIRNETTNINAPTVGLKAKINLSEDTKVNIGGNMDLVSISGNVDYTSLNPNNGYTQWRKTTYSGNGTVFSVEGGLEQKITGGLSASVSGGMKFGSVNTSGKEVITLKSAPGWSLEKDYSQPFNFNNAFGKIEVKYNF